jgi:hypothetical protein
MFTSSLRLLSTIIADEFQCEVCYGTLSDPLINPGCGHRYCTACIRDSLVRCGNTCPKCRDYIESYSSLRRDLNFEGLVSLSSDHALKIIVLYLQSTSIFNFLKVFLPTRPHFELVLISYQNCKTFKTF